MSAVVTLALKDVKILFRDKFALFWIFAFPLMYALFFGVLFSDSGGGGGSRIAIAVVDEDRSDASRALVDRLVSHGSLHVDDTDAGPGTLTAEEARDAVRKGRKTAFVRIPKGYGESSFGMFGGGSDPPPLEVGLDPSRSAEAGFLQGILMESMFRGMTERFGDKAAMQRDIERTREEIASAEDLPGPQKLVLQGFMTAFARFVEDVDPEVLEGGPGGMSSQEERIRVVEVAQDDDEGPRSSFDITFPAAMIWGLMGVAIGFAITLVRERTRGTLLRLTVAPIGRTQILAGKALGCALTCMIVMLFLLAFGHFALGVRIGSLPLALVAMVCTAACFTGLMMAASVMGRTEEAVAGASWGLMLPLAMIGGGMIPLIAMPPWLASLSDVSPFKWGIYAVEGAVWRAFAISDMVFPCTVLVAMGLAFFAFGAVVFRRAS